MKIYLVTRTDRVGYDEYDGVVVVAESPEDAMKQIDERHSNVFGELGNDYPKNMNVEEIKMDRGIVLESFNAG